MNHPTAVLPTVEIFEHFERLISQRSKIDRNDYFNPMDAVGNRQAYWNGVKSMRQDQRNISQDGTRARKALKAARVYPFNPEAMAEALSAYSGRLEWVGTELEYTTGQYFPTEYRIAAAIVLERYCEIVRVKFLPTYTDPLYYQSIEQIKRGAYNRGSHWFDKSSMRFFGSRVYPQLFYGKTHVFFISSEKQPDTHHGSSGYVQAHRRAYSVRSFETSTADIGTVGEFQGHGTKAQAVRAAETASRMEREQ